MKVATNHSFHCEHVSFLNSETTYRSVLQGHYVTHLEIFGPPITTAAPRAKVEVHILLIGSFLLSVSFVMVAGHRIQEQVQSLFPLCQWRSCSHKHYKVLFVLMAIKVIKSPISKKLFHPLQSFWELVLFCARSHWNPVVKLGIHFWLFWSRNIWR